MSKTAVFYDGGCSDCQKVASLLSATGVDYIRYNIKGHPYLMDEAKRQNIKTLPTIIIGNKVIEGYNESQLRSALS